MLLRAQERQKRRCEKAFAIFTCTHRHLADPALLPQLPDVLAERPVIVFGKWREKTGSGPTRVVIEGRAANGPYTQSLPIDAQAEWQGTGALRHLWARHRIAALSDEESLTGGDAQKAAITKLGLHYSLLSPYTTFIAVDQVVRNPGGQGATANRPSPFAEGVSNLDVGEAGALGAEVGSTPEPGCGVFEPWWNMPRISAVALKREPEAACCAVPSASRTMLLRAAGALSTGAKGVFCAASRTKKPRCGRASTSPCASSWS